MEPQQALEIGQMAIYTVLLTAAPLLLSSLCVGLTIAIFQAATQVHEMTLVFVPKIAAVLLGIIVFGSFMMRMVLEFTQNIFAMIAQGPGSQGESERKTMQKDRGQRDRQDRSVGNRGPRGGRSTSCDRSPIDAAP